MGRERERKGEYREGEGEYGKGEKGGRGGRVRRESWERKSGSGEVK